MQQRGDQWFHTIDAPLALPTGNDANNQEY